MAIDIKFDLVGNPEPPTILLSKRNGNILGQLEVNEESIDISDKFNDASEFSFTLNKYYFDEKEEIEKIIHLWNDVVNFKLVYCQEWDMWFEIKVELDEETETVKTVFCTQLGQAELSQAKLYNIHINEEGDSNWDTSKEIYKRTILYDENDKSISLLDRLLKDKAPHYSIIHVDDTIKNIQRTFSFDKTTIYDAFMEIAEEIGCLFVFHSNSKNGKIQRTISVYDLQQNCLKCGHRGEFTEVCPKCGELVNGEYGFKFGYGEDTRIFVTSDELASGGIQLTSDTDEVKNCFKLEAGDDLMTSTVRNCNPNGTDYMWRFSNETKSDMSEELVNKLENYDNKYKEYYTKKITLETDLIDDYNTLVDKYSEYYNANSSYCYECGHRGNFEDSCPNCGSNNVSVGNRLQEINETINGYSELMNAYYNTIDLALYLKSSLMPNVDIAQITDTDANEQVTLLTKEALSPVAVASMESLSWNTADSTVELMARTIVKTTYKVKVNSSSLSDDKKTWTGNFKVTNYSDEKDTAISDLIEIELTGDEEEYIAQLIEKTLNKEDTDDLSISGLFEIENIDEFCEELKKYALNPLMNFSKACQTCIGILADQGIGDNKEDELYINLYKPYYDKLVAIEEEIKVREEEVNIISGVYDENENLVTKGLQHYIEDCRNEIQNDLNFQNYLGEELWLEFCCYRREDTYSNNNYISDGLNNADLFKRALQFFEVAENEIYKSSETQYSISTSLNNLLAIDKFKPLVDSFKVGNWIRIQVDDNVYKLRLLEYNIDFGSFDNISVEFSDVTKVKNGITDVKNTLSQASSMATSYSSVKRQASQGEKSNATITSWVDNGLSATNTKIVDGYDESLLMDKNGLLCRHKDPITGEYDSEQIKIFKSTIAITDDNWETIKTAIGKYYYIDPITGEEKMAYGVNGETIVGKLLIGEDLIISNNNGRLEFDDNGLIVTGTKNTVVIDPNNNSTFSIKNNSNGSYILYINDDGNLVVTGDIVATSLKMEDGSVIEGINVGNISGLHSVAISGNYNDLENKPNKLSEFENDGVFITKDANNLTYYYKKNEISNLMNSKADTNDLAKVAITGSYNDLLDTPEIITNDDLNKAVNDAVNSVKENGEFDGEDGVSVTHYWEDTTLVVTSASGTSSSDLKGEKGDDGYTPVRGIDYWTNADKEEIINAILAQLQS